MSVRFLSAHVARVTSRHLSYTADDDGERSMQRRWQYIAMAVLVGCSSEGEPDGSDAGMDATVAVDVSADAPIDAQPSPDVVVDASMQSDAVDDTACVDACRQMSLSVTIDATQLDMERAFYGLTSPAMSSSGDWELHVEAHRGGSDGCPEMNSPSPDQTVIVTGFPILLDGNTYAEADGLVASVLDFAGDFGTELSHAATAESVTMTAARVCTDCVDADPNSFVAFDVEGTLNGGAVSGHVFATHCPSMDFR